MLNKNLHYALRSNLKRKMEETNKNPFSLEKEAGLAKNSVRNILRAKSLNPGIEIISAIAKVLGCPIDELVGDNVNTPFHTKLLEEQVPHNNYDIELLSKVTNIVLSILQEDNKNISDLDTLLMVIKISYKYFSIKQKSSNERETIELIINEFL